MCSHCTDATVQLAILNPGRGEGTPSIPAIFSHASVDHIQHSDHYSTLLPSGPESSTLTTTPHCCPRVQIQHSDHYSTLLPSGPESSTLTMFKCFNHYNTLTSTPFHTAALRSRVQHTDHYSTLLPSGPESSTLTANSLKRRGSRSSCKPEKKLSPQEDSAELRCQLHFAKEESALMCRKLAKMARENEAMAEELSRFRSLYGGTAEGPASEHTHAHAREAEVRVHLRLVEEEATLLSRRIAELEVENRGLRAEMEEMRYPELPEGAPLPEGEAGKGAELLQKNMVAAEELTGTSVGVGVGLNLCVANGVTPQGDASPLGSEGHALLSHLDLGAESHKRGGALSLGPGHYPALLNIRDQARLLSSAIHLLTTSVHAHRPAPVCHMTPPITQDQGVVGKDTLSHSLMELQAQLLAFVRRVEALEVSCGEEAPPTLPNAHPTRLTTDAQETENSSQPKQPNNRNQSEQQVKGQAEETDGPGCNGMVSQEAEETDTEEDEGGCWGGRLWQDVPLQTLLQHKMRSQDAQLQPVQLRQSLLLLSLQLRSFLKHWHHGNGLELEEGGRDFLEGSCVKRLCLLMEEGGLDTPPAGEDPLPPETHKHHSQQGTPMEAHSDYWLSVCSSTQFGGVCSTLSELKGVLQELTAEMLEERQASRDLAQKFARAKTAWDAERSELLRQITQDMSTCAGMQEFGQWRGRGAAFRLIPQGAYRQADSSSLSWNLDTTLRYRSPEESLLFTQHCGPEESLLFTQHCSPEESLLFTQHCSPEESLLFTQHCGPEESLLFTQHCSPEESLLFTQHCSPEESLLFTQHCGPDESLLFTQHCGPEESLLFTQHCSPEESLLFTQHCSPEESLLFTQHCGPEESLLFTQHCSPEESLLFTQHCGPEESLLFTQHCGPEESLLFTQHCSPEESLLFTQHCGPEESLLFTQHCGPEESLLFTQHCSPEESLLFTQHCGPEESLLFTQHCSPEESLLFTQHCGPEESLLFTQHCGPEESLLFTQHCSPEESLLFTQHCSPEESLLFTQHCGPEESLLFTQHFSSGGSVLKHSSSDLSHRLLMSLELTGADCMANPAKITSLRNSDPLWLTMALQDTCTSCARTELLQFRSLCEEVPEKDKERNTGRETQANGADLQSSELQAPPRVLPRAQGPRRYQERSDPYGTWGGPTRTGSLAGLSAGCGAEVQRSHTAPERTGLRIYFSPPVARRGNRGGEGQVGTRALTVTHGNNVHSLAPGKVAHSNAHCGWPQVLPVMEDGGVMVATNLSDDMKEMTRERGRADAACQTVALATNTVGVTSVALQTEEEGLEEENHAHLCGLPRRQISASLERMVPRPGRPLKLGSPKLQRRISTPSSLPFSSTSSSSSSSALSSSSLSSTSSSTSSFSSCRLEGPVGGASPWRVRGQNGSAWTRSMVPRAGPPVSRRSSGLFGVVDRGVARGIEPARSDGGGSAGAPHKHASGVGGGKPAAAGGVHRYGIVQEFLRSVCGRGQGPIGGAGAGGRGRTGGGVQAGKPERPTPRPSATAGSDSITTGSETVPRILNKRLQRGEEPARVGGVKSRGNKSVEDAACECTSRSLTSCFARPSRSSSRHAPGQCRLRPRDQCQTSERKGQLASE
ncbi:hypothetical protein JZ751_012960 [Albula glossodonta]|uniref:SOGA coiled-coil domain-containing protein n=1 Tax=Albula glossodonta TaxID=121402 RepID=A0A8T2N1D4_9TELE|nr:hypothetical protein JZ751_012960 [Albula glossodonta]